MKKISVIIGIVSLSIILVSLQIVQKKSKNSLFKIGVLQTASHPALDRVCDGFVQELESRFNGKIECIIKNAEGSVAHAQTIATSLIADRDIDAFFSIATLATQVMANKESQRPVLFSAVTDPHALGINNHSNVAGVSDMTDVNATVNLLKELISTAKTVALLFNTGEINSVVMTKALCLSLEQNDLQPIEIGITSESEIPTAITVACKKADAIITPLDNIVALSIDMIAQQALLQKKPLIVSDNLLVEHGAVAASGVDYKKVGKKSAEIMIDLLGQKKEPQEIGIVTVPSDQIVINEQICDALDLVIPLSLKNAAIMIGEK